MGFRLNVNVNANTFLSILVVVILAAVVISLSSLYAAGRIEEAKNFAVFVVVMSFTLVFIVVLLYFATQYEGSSGFGLRVLRNDAL